MLVKARKDPFKDSLKAGVFDYDEDDDKEESDDEENDQKKTKDEGGIHIRISLKKIFKKIKHLWWRIKLFFNPRTKKVPKKFRKRVETEIKTASTPFDNFLSRLCGIKPAKAS